MHFIKVGTCRINLDDVRSVNEVEGERGTINIFYTNGSVTKLRSNEGAAEVLQYIDSVATDVFAPEHTDSDYQDFRNKGGQLSYEAWKTKGARYERYLNNSESWWSHPENKELVRKLEADLLV